MTIKKTFFTQQTQCAIFECQSLNWGEKLRNRLFEIVHGLETYSLRKKIIIFKSENKNTICSIILTDRNSEKVDVEII